MNLKPMLVLLAGLSIQTSHADEIRHYRYDAMQRLTGADYDGQGSIDYAYDNLGNRLVETQQTGTLPTNHPPSAVQAIAPADGAAAVETTARNLMWTASTDPDAGDVVSYFVYLGPSATPPLVYSGTSPYVTYCLAPNRTYHWQVNARDNHNAETPSAEWTFKTLDTGHAWCDLVENFEDVDAFDKLPWQRQQPPASSGWQQTTAFAYDGSGAAASPAGLKNSQKASMSIQLTTTSGKMSFWYAVSSAKGDYLEFYIDGQKKVAKQGEMGWTKAEVPVAEGLHTFTWKYIKNLSGVAGQDRAWVDDIFFPVHEDTVIK
jgi:hypothetical protein